MSSQLKAYYLLAKPGIIYGNVISTIGGFLFASQGHINFFLFVATVLGTSLVIGGSCVFNNYLDRDIDKKMSRTKNRPLVSGTVGTTSALVYGTILFLLGLVLLFVFTNLLTTVVCIIGALFYVIVYGAGKRYTNFGTEIGSISGAMPILGGYTAVTNRIDGAGILLFLILIFWQMPHFFAIALFRMKEYEAAGIPITPLTRGIKQTKVLILFYLLGFGLFISLLTYFGYTTIWFLGLMGLFSLYWLFLGIQGFYTQHTNPWARKVFLTSLVVLLIFSLLISVDHYLPH